MSDEATQSILDDIVGSRDEALSRMDNAIVASRDEVNRIDHRLR
jgi:hypothetical protein